MKKENTDKSKEIVTDIATAMPSSVIIISKLQLNNSSKEPPQLQRFIPVVYRSS